MLNICDRQLYFTMGRRGGTRWRGGLIDTALVIHQIFSRIKIRFDDKPPARKRGVSHIKSKPNNLRQKRGARTRRTFIRGPRKLHTCMYNSSRYSASSASSAIHDVLEGSEGNGFTAEVIPSW